MGIHDVFHASLLTPYKETDEHGTNFLEPPPKLIEGEEEWEVEQILGKRHLGRGKKLQYLVRWKDYSPAHDQWVDKSDITAKELIEIFERENREERPPRRSIRTPRKKANEVIRSIHLSPTRQHYHRSMPSNANTVDTQQVHADNGDAPTEIPSSQTTLPTSIPNETTNTIIDAAVFAGTTHAASVQVRDGTAPLSFVPIGGTFTKDATTPQTESINPSVANKDGKDHAPSPLTLSPIPTQSERSTSPSPLPPPPRPQLSHKPRTNSIHSSLLTDPNTHRERDSSEDMSTLWRRIQALKRFRAAHNRYPGGFSLPGLAKAAPLIAKLVKMTEPPRHISDYMMDFDIQYRVDVTLARGLTAVLPQLEEYLDTDDSRDVLKEQTHDTRNVTKEPSDDNRDIDKELVDNSRHVLKNKASRTIEWGENIEIVPIGSNPTPRTTPSTLPALEALVQMTRARVLMEEADDSSNDEAPIVKMEV